MSESKDISSGSFFASLPTLTAKPEYALMAQNVSQKMPAVERDSANFYKSHSQFMAVTLDVTAITGIRSIKHTLAEVERARAALQESYVRVEKKKVKVKIKERALESEEDPLKRKLIELDILGFKSDIESSTKYMEAGLRRLNFFVNQHDNLLRSLGKSEITERDYEEEETKYHIMTAMKQALISSRSRGGVIDEGNMIYLFDLGINGADAQAEVFAYLHAEKEIVDSGAVPSHEMTVKWLEACAEKWKECPGQFASSRGFELIDGSSLVSGRG